MRIGNANLYADGDINTDVHTNSHSYVYTYAYTYRDRRDNEPCCSRGLRDLWRISQSNGNSHFQLVAR